MKPFPQRGRYGPLDGVKFVAEMFKQSSDMSLDGHCGRLLRLHSFLSGHTVVANFRLCALSVLWLIDEFCDRFHGSSNNKCQSFIHHPSSSLFSLLPLFFVSPSPLRPSVVLSFSPFFLFSLLFSTSLLHSCS